MSPGSSFMVFAIAFSAVSTKGVLNLHSRCWSSESSGPLLVKSPQSESSPESLVQVSMASCRKDWSQPVMKSPW